MIEKALDGVAVDSLQKSHYSWWWSVGAFTVSRFRIAVNDNDMLIYFPPNNYSMNP